MTKYRVLVFCLISLVLIVGCDEKEPVTPGLDVVETGTDPAVSVEEASSTLPAPKPRETPEPTTVPPTMTPAEPLAALVNDNPIFELDFQRELARYSRAQEELGLEQSEVNHQQVVLDALIEKELIAQAADSLGIAITPEIVLSRLQELEEAAGGPENLDAWLETNQFSREEFLAALEDEMLAEKTVEIVTKDVPTAVEQVHARYLQVDDEALAQTILEQLQGGVDFADLAREYSLDRMTGEAGGDLGYFAAGSLLVPEVEAAAFALQPGEISGVVAGTRADGTGLIFYIVELIERDPQRTLTADLRSQLLQETFESWLEEQWQMARITRFIEASG